MTTLFYYLPVRDKLVYVTNLHDQDVDYLDNHISKTFEDWFSVRNICNDEVLVNRVKIFAHEKKLIYIKQTILYFASYVN